MFCREKLNELGSVKQQSLEAVRAEECHSQRVDDFVGAVELVDIVFAGVVEYGIEIRDLDHTTGVEGQRTCRKPSYNLTIVFFLS